MIYWFSATGNSRYAAQAIRAATGDMCVDLLPLLREGGTQIGAAPAHIQKLCARCGLEYRGMAAAIARGFVRSKTS